MDAGMACPQEAGRGGAGAAGEAGREGAAVAHLNVIGFAQAVAAAADRSLADRPFVVAVPGPRATVLDVSPRGRQEGLAPGMSLAAAERLVRGLAVAVPDEAAQRRAAAGLKRIAGRYAPLVEDAGGGHLYLDLAGTGRLFGPPERSALRIRSEARAELGLDPAVALAANKLTAKVLTRLLLPSGFAVLGRGNEAAFLAGQDLRLLPGIGPALFRLLDAAGVRTIGALASLSDAEARLLLGRRAAALRDAARGLDPDVVVPGGPEGRIIRRSWELSADTAELESLRGALMLLAEDGGMELRRCRLCAGRLELSALYADGRRDYRAETPRRPLALDSDLIPAAERCLAVLLERRIRLRSLHLVLSDLAPDRRGRDLFAPEAGDAQERLQRALDGTRRRYGKTSLLRGTSLLAWGAHA
jgi:DNA polymerase-4